MKSSQTERGESMILSANAKINLFLDITSRRPDGYHEIQSVMQTVSLSDTVEVLRIPEGIELSGNLPFLSYGENNLAYRAAAVFLASLKERENAPLGGIRIHLEKRIPLEAGLAGGSADAAAVLRGMNALYGTPFETEELCRIGKRIGADVPFCIVGGTKAISGIGDLISPSAPMPDALLVIAKRGTGVSTPAAYGALDRLYDNFDIGKGYIPHSDTLEILKRGLGAGDLLETCNGFYNIFESVVLKEHEGAAFLKDALLRKGAIAAMMSGSGPSVFGVFRDIDAAESAAKELNRPSKDAVAFVARPVGEPGIEKC